MLQKYWNVLNARQQDLGGDPHVGCKLGALFFEAGFENTATTPLLRLTDKRDARAGSEFLSYWKALLHSASPELLSAGLSTNQDFLQVMQEIDELQTNPHSIFHYSPMRAVGTKA